MGLEGIRRLNEISSIRNGQNWILEKVFGGNEGKYSKRKSEATKNT